MSYDLEINVLEKEISELKKENDEIRKILRDFPSFLECSHPECRALYVYTPFEIKSMYCYNMKECDGCGKKVCDNHYIHNVNGFFCVKCTDTI